MRVIVRLVLAASLVLPSCSAAADEANVITSGPTAGTPAADSGSSADEVSALVCADQQADVQLLQSGWSRVVASRDTPGHLEQVDTFAEGVKVMADINNEHACEALDALENLDVSAATLVLVAHTRLPAPVQAYDDVATAAGVYALALGVPATFNL